MNAVTPSTVTAIVPVRPVLLSMVSAAYPGASPAFARRAGWSLSMREQIVRYCLNAGGTAFGRTSDSDLYGNTWTTTCPTHPFVTAAQPLLN